MGLRNDFEGEVWVSKGKRRMVVLILFLQVMLRPCPLGAWPGSRELKGLFESLATSSQPRDKSGLCLSPKLCAIAKLLLFQWLQIRGSTFPDCAIFSTFPHPIKLWHCPCQTPQVDPMDALAQNPRHPFFILSNNLAWGKEITAEINSLLKIALC